MWYASGLIFVFFCFLFRIPWTCAAGRICTKHMSTLLDAILSLSQPTLTYPCEDCQRLSTVPFTGGKMTSMYFVRGILRRPGLFLTRLFAQGPYLSVGIDLLAKQDLMCSMLFFSLQLQDIKRKNGCLGFEVRTTGCRCFHVGRVINFLQCYSYEDVHRQFPRICIRLCRIQILNPVSVCNSLVNLPCTMFMLEQFSSRSWDAGQKGQHHVLLWQLLWRTCTAVGRTQCALLQGWLLLSCWFHPWLTHMERAVLDTWEEPCIHPVALSKLLWVSIQLWCTCIESWRISRVSEQSRHCSEVRWVLQALLGFSRSGIEEPCNWRDRASTWWRETPSWSPSAKYSQSTAYPSCLSIFVCDWVAWICFSRILKGQMGKPDKVGSCILVSFVNMFDAMSTGSTSTLSHWWSI